MPVTAERAFKILELLAGKQDGLTVAQLYERFQKSDRSEIRVIDRRTLQRDLTSLVRHGAATVVEPGAHTYRYKAATEQFVPGDSLDLLRSPIAGMLKSVLNFDLVPTRGRHGHGPIRPIEIHDDWPFESPSGGHPEVFSHLNTALDALRSPNQQKLTIKYSGEQKVRSRDCYPLAVIVYRKTHYLIACDFGGRNTSSLALHRITSMSRSDGALQKTIDRESIARTCIERLRSHPRESTPVRLVIDCHDHVLRQIEERIPATGIPYRVDIKRNYSAEKEQRPHRVTIDGLRDTMSLFSWLISWDGGRLEVIEPTKIREDIYKHVKSLLAAY